MVTFLSAALTYLRAFLVSRHNLGLEVPALRQQVTVYKRKQPRQRLHQFDRLFWMALRRLWTNWADALVLVKPDTVVSWHRTGFRLFWRWRSRASRAGRPKVEEEIREFDPPHESRKSNLGRTSHSRRVASSRFEISEPTVSRYLRGLKRFPRKSKAKQWLAFLNTHREVIAAFDFFTVRTLSFRRLYCFFVIEHRKRQILQCNVTLHPTSEWIVQQQREAFPLPCPYQYVLFDHDAKFGNEVVTFLKASALKPMRTSVRGPWQNGIAERWVAVHAANCSTISFC
jgi:hypothetical protein